MDTMKLGDKQRLFTYKIYQLIQFAYDHGYELTFGDAFRDPRLHGPFGQQSGYGRGSSCHKLRLAVDFNLFKDGEYLTSTEDHRVLGEFWESLHPLCRWGGRFSSADGNHYSFEHEGNR